MIAWLAAAALADGPIAPRTPEPRDLPGVAGGASELEVAVTIDGVPCRFARGRVEGEAEGRVRVVLGALGEATARWASTQGELSVVADDAGVPACDLPPIVDVRLPTAWTPLPLRRPATEVLFDDPDATVMPFGADGRAFQVFPPGERAVPVAFLHADQPPTRLRIRVDPDAEHPPGRVVDVGVGTVTRVPLEGAPWLANAGGAHATFQGLGQELLVFGVSEGEEWLGLREGDGLPTSVRAVVGPAPRSTKLPVVEVPGGGTRRFRPDRAVTATFVALPEVLSITPKGKVLVMTGTAPGETDVVLVDADGAPFVVHVVVR